ncbi:hypothetical protein GCM10027404_01010 [Arthrobacter tumbae]|uniref:hypothetical protein n=1 Tax=Arthrobacter tumbae TaxID=163874 RepID=UPI00195DD555|nr:hypothetical protein [Arthrobacter tumbae]MBM7780455.1 hypothetical protein [Arthrobacter tumbae]
MSDVERRLRVLEARNEILHGDSSGPSMAELGELGRLTVAALESWDSIRGDAVQAKAAFTLMRVASLALDVLQGREIVESVQVEVRALMSPTRERFRVYGWQEHKHPDALALFEQLQRERHL